MGWEKCGGVGWREGCGEVGWREGCGGVKWREEEWDGGRDVGSVHKQNATVHVWCSICTLTVSTEWPAVCTHGH